VSRLLQQRTDVNATAIDGTTALHWAVRADDLTTADTLIRAGANVKASSRHGITPLYLAAGQGHAAMIRRLLVAGADPNGTSLSDGNQHNFSPLPVVLAGGASGRLKGGRHLVFPKDTRMSNLLLAMLDTLGVRLETFGDSTGMLTI
jgi:ankyrin repeat protein